MVQVNKATLRRVKLLDWAARWVITLGGILVIASVIAVILLLISVTFPLFTGAAATIRVDVPLPGEARAGDVLRLGVDLVELERAHGEDSLSAYTLERDGTFRFYVFDDGERAEAGRSSGRRAVVFDRQRVTPGGDDPTATVEFVDQSTGSEYTLLWSDGSVSLVKAVAIPKFDDLGRRSVTYDLRTLANLARESEGRTVRAVARAAEDGSATCAKLLDNGRIVVTRQTATQSLFGEGETATHRLEIASGFPGAVTAMTLNRRGNTLFAGTQNGYLCRWKFDDEGEIVKSETVAVPDKAAVTALAMVFGDVSVAVGDAGGNLATWAPVRDESSERLRLIHQLARYDGPLRDILPSERNKSLLSLDGAGRGELDYMTSDEHLLTLGGDPALRLLGYSPRGNAMIGLTEGGNRLIVWQIDSPHPEISWHTLFGKVWYENHDEPKYMWQSSGTDEPKFSLVPVIFGTLKATFYAMLFAVPLALLSAMYVSHFTTPGFRGVIKPTVEVMAAVPTVVIGFLILLWAAPLVGNWIVGVFVALLTVPLSFVLFMLVWQGLRRFDWAKRVEHGREFLVLVPVLVLGAAAAAWATGPIENYLYGGEFNNFGEWFFARTGHRYDQLNSIVVAMGLGFAVIPIIFSISEDALSSIPYSLNAASLALGASRWQTLRRVILPSASPGIFAAMMIGFGRAVGETMIVFMAAGNTPIVDPSPFNGFRTLSANIAVEISEAARGGTLYRVLFLCAVLLFLMTFVLNTAAELVRVRLRKKYGRY